MTEAMSMSAHMHRVAVLTEVKVALNQQGRVAGRPQATGRILQTFGDWFCELHVGSRVYRYDGVFMKDAVNGTGLK